MMKRYSILITAILVILLFANESFAQRQKLAQTGLKFLSYPTDARSVGMGEAATSIASGAAGMFYNPATMSSLKEAVDVQVGVGKWIADINYLYGAVALNPFDGNYGKFGVSVMSVDYGDLIGTIVDGSQSSGYREVGTFRPTAMSVGLGYSLSLSEKFSVGANIKYVYQNLGSSVTDVVAGSLVSEDNSIGTTAVDFGILYHTGFKSLDFGMSVRNFSAELKYKEEGFQLPLNFKIGVSMNMVDILPVDGKVHKLLLSVDASHPRDYPEQVYVGLEYVFMDMLAVRGGFSAPNDERQASFGLGFRPEIAGTKIGVDYSYTPFGVFSSVHNFSVRFIY